MRANTVCERSRPAFGALIIGVLAIVSRSDAQRILFGFGGQAAVPGELVGPAADGPGHRLGQQVSLGQRLGDLRVRGGPANPMADGDVREKFVANASLALSEEDVSALERAILTLDERTDLQAAFAPLGRATAVPDLKPVEP